MRLNKTAVVVSSWLAAGALLIALGRGVVHAPAWVASAAGAAALLAVALACAGITGRKASLARRRWRRFTHRRHATAVVVATPWAFALIAATGALRSPALALLPISVVLLQAGPTNRRRRVATLAAAAGALVVLLAAHAALYGTPAFAEIAAAAVLLATVVALLARLHSDRSPTVEHDASAVRSAAAGLSGAVDGGSPRASASAEGLVLEEYLLDVRHALGSADVVLWRPLRPRGELQAVARVAGPAASHEALGAERAGLLEWSREQELLTCDAELGAVRFAAAPVRWTHETGVLSVSASEARPMDLALVKQWLPRFATHVGRLTGLVEARQGFESESRQSEQLLNAAQAFQAHRSIDTLGAVICAHSLALTSGARAALVRWHADRGSGEIHGVSRGHDLAPGRVVVGESHVGAWCQTGLPMVWEDARLLDRSTPIYDPAEGERRVGSLGVVPVKQGELVTGAVVIEGEAPGDVRIRDVRAVRVLAALAAVSLDTVWEIEEVTRRARTDQLTGLFNRRYFDEQLARVLAEADRFGGSVSLIIADIDLFKRVNDTHGHKAGDDVLRAVSRVFRDGVRTVDIAARFGGEELAVLLPQTSLAGACELAERLRRAVEMRPVLSEATSISVTASFGVASYPERVSSRDALFPAADRALYRAKAEGRNCVRSTSVTISPTET